MVTAQRDSGYLSEGRGCGAVMPPLGACLGAEPGGVVGICFPGILFQAFAAGQEAA